MKTTAQQTANASASSSRRATPAQLKLSGGTAQTGCATTERLDALDSLDTLEHSAQLYWDLFYEKQKHQSPPSQFAAFVASEFKSHPLFIDIGCGNGRDTLFFSYLGHNVIGIDKSSCAIDFCNAQIISENQKLSTFLNADVSELDINDSLFTEVKSRKKLIYSRFFLHAIQEQKEDELFEFIVKICKHPEDVIALEFRTEEDAHNPKLAQAHFRRFISTKRLQEKLESKFKLRINYQVQGYGLAVYGAEDAHVCRMILSK